RSPRDTTPRRREAPAPGLTGTIGLSSTAIIPSSARFSYMCRSKVISTRTVGSPSARIEPAASSAITPMRVFIEGSTRSDSRRPAPGQMAQAREKRLAGLEDLEAGAAKRLMELRGAEVSMLALAKELEGDR